MVESLEITKLKNNIYIKYFIASLFFAFLIIILFNNTYTYGIQFDEVFRKNNLIPFFNPNAEPYDDSIFSIKIFDISIPITYKQYISTAYLIPDIPIFLWDDLFIGMRTLNAVYFFLSIVIFFIILSQLIDLKYSFLTSLLILTSPLLFPEITFGFVQPLPILFLSIGFYLIYLFHHNKMSIYLFIGSFILFLGANIYFYFLWVIASLIITSLIFYQDFWKEILSSPKHIFALGIGFILGLINFIIYNIYNNFPSIRVLFLRYFYPSEYNSNPIDGKVSIPFIEELIIKINSLIAFFDAYWYIYLFTGITILISFGFIAIKLFQQKNLIQYKNYYFCLANVLVILFFIIITPNTTRAGHYCYLIPFLELTVLSLMLLLMKLYNLSSLKKYLLLLFIILILINGFVIAEEICQYNKTRGTILFSPAIFDFKDYVDEKQINSKSIVFIQWGTYSQLYFLNKGEFFLNNLVFQMLGADSPKQRYYILESFILTHYSKNEYEEIYFPIYREGIGLLYFDEIKKDLQNFLLTHGGELELITTFNEKDGKPLIYLYRLSNIDVIVNNILNQSYSADTADINLSQMKQLTKTTLYGIDRLDNIIFPLKKEGITINKTLTPFTAISGWAVDSPNNSIAKAVFISIDEEMIIPTQYLWERDDVAQHFNNPKWIESGFRGYININDLKNGYHLIKIIIVSNENNCYYLSEGIRVNIVS